MRTCPACGADLSSTHYRRKYCSTVCQRKSSRNSARAHARASYAQKFVGVDGEGINLPDGSHRYVMLSVGQETLFKNGDELSCDDILAFLYGHYLDNPDKRTAYIGFYLGYDFTHWFKGIPKDRAESLFTTDGIAKRRPKSEHRHLPFPVYLGTSWEVDMLAMKRLRFRPHRCHGTKGICGCGQHSETLPKNSDAEWLYVCDVGSFFQTSFVNVIDPKGWPNEAPCTANEYQTILAGKGKRADDVSLDNAAEWYPEMAAYNRLENSILERVMEIYAAGFGALGVKLDRTSFYGPGQAAQKWLNTQAKERYITREQIIERVPIDMLDKWRRSYYGGRFEIFYHGNLSGPAYEYDIQSAYPHSIANLPCLCSVKWLKQTHPVDHPLTLVYATVYAASRLVAPLPQRLPSGNIRFPAATTGWYRWAEIHAAIDAGLVTETVLHEVMNPVALCYHDAPLKNLAGLFQQRLAVGKATPQGKALKLIYNSTYGKMAQSVGSPKYANPIYASIITSDCRIRLLQAIGTHPQGIESLVMCATDGIYFNEPHPSMPTVDTNVEQLGAWETAELQNLTLFKPGVYWHDVARQAIADGKAAKFKSRGVSARALQERLHDIETDFNNGIEVPTIPITVPFSIVSPRLALARGKWETAGLVTRDLTRTEAASIRPKRTDARRITKGLYRSFVVDNLGAQSYESSPYPKTFGMDELLEYEYYTPDGLALDIGQQNIIELREGN